MKLAFEMIPFILFLNSFLPSLGFVRVTIIINIFNFVPVHYKGVFFLIILYFYIKIIVS